MGEIHFKVPQFNYLEKSSCGSRIPRSQFCSGLNTVMIIEDVKQLNLRLLWVSCMHCPDVLQAGYQENNIFHSYHFHCHYHNHLHHQESISNQMFSIFFLFNLSDWQTSISSLESQYWKHNYYNP